MKRIFFVLIICLASASAQDAVKTTIYRPKRNAFAMSTPSVYIDNQEVARLDNGRFLVLALSPGKHVVTSSMKTAPLAVDVEPGKPLYFEMVILPGTWRGGGRLIPVAEDDALPALKKLKPLDAHWITAPAMVWKESLANPGGAT